MNSAERAGERLLSDVATPVAASSPRPRRLVLRGWMALSLLLVAVGCGSTPPPRDLSGQLQLCIDGLFEGLDGRLPARSGVTLFVPESAVHPRQMARFRADLDRALRTAVSNTSYVYRSSGEDVFLLSEVRPADFDSAGLPEGAADLFAREYRAGTETGWLAFHDYGAYLNRLAVGDRNWYESLPESFRAQLSHTIDAVIRVQIGHHESRSRLDHVHGIDIDLIEVGSQRTLHRHSCEVQTPYSLQ